MVCGGGFIGLSTAMMLADDGHDVVVLEADGEGPPTSAAQAWHDWTRAGVRQFRQPHVLLTRARQVLDEELPGLTDLLLAAGCVPVNYLESLPPGVSDRAPRPGDADMVMVTGRRPVVEAVVAGAAVRRPGVHVRRGERVAGLTTGSPARDGVPHVTGVCTERGEVITADLVVDATGRRARSEQWLCGIGARPPAVTREDRGFVYYTRFFTGPERPRRIGPTLTPIGSISLLVLEGDNDTWSVTVCGLGGDAPLKELRNTPAFDRVVGACPLQAHWLDGTPLTDVVAMGGIPDRHGRLVVDGRPVVTGLVTVGDAWACTNPSVGRGVSLGLMHAQQLRGTVREHLDRPDLLAAGWDRTTEETVGAYHRVTVAGDRARSAQMRALALGEPPPPADPVLSRFLTAASTDADVFRALISTSVCTALPQEVLARPEIRAKVDQVELDGPPAPYPGPDRARLLELLAA